ncbi:hypothetical protein D6C77_07228 [Aureobasidium pullulans]|nr:hypothetical protein D6C97_06667 [Aureobasidium pullulans]TIA55770.1 hypothetical protein D6C77_07228 [Aureobasidium pullulans]
MTDSHHGVLAKLSCAAFQQMQELSYFVKGHPSEIQTPLNDALIRFQMWARNINAFQNNELSLEYRVGDAPKLRESFETRLKDLQEDLSDLKDTLSTISDEDIAIFVSSELEPMKEPASTLWEDTEPTLTFAQDSCLDLFQLLKAINEDVSSLFKLSALIKQAVHRDPYTTALARVTDIQVVDIEADIELIGGQFPRLKQPSLQWLRLRLAKANHVRRLYLEDHGEHDDSKMASEGTESDLAETASGVDLEKFHIFLESNDAIHDNQSQASVASSVMETSSDQSLTVRDLEDVRQGEEVFVCPYCESVQTLETQAAWRRHVLGDLRAREIDRIAAEECVFCDWPTKISKSNTATFRADKILVKQEEYRRHVCSHLEQAVLLTATTATIEEGFESDGSQDVLREDPQNTEKSEAHSLCCNSGRLTLQRKHSLAQVRPSFTTVDSEVPQEKAADEQGEPLDAAESLFTPCVPVFEEDGYSGDNAIESDDNDYEDSSDADYEDSSDDDGGLRMVRRRSAPYTSSGGKGLKVSSPYFSRHPRRGTGSSAFPKKSSRSGSNNSMKNS